EPSFSPDGRWILFATGTAFKKVSVDGGTPLVLSPATSPRGASLSSDGTVVAALGSVSHIVRFPPSGGDPMPLTELQSGDISHRWPQILPGGKAILYTANSTVADFEDASIQVLTVADHRQKVIQRGGFYGRYVPSGHLIYVSQGTLF